MNLELVLIDEQYNKFLHSKDNRVQYNYSDLKKTSKPVLGVLISLDKFDYFVPLSSAKEKFKDKVDGITSHKIVDSKGVVLAVLNFNNMIPATKSVVEKINYKEISQNNKNYASLLNKEQKICNKISDVLINKAKKLYSLYVLNSIKGKVYQACCDFPKLEKACRNYEKATRA